MNFEIKQIPHKGRALFAKKHFLNGDIILTERPIVSCQFSWNAYYGYSSCDNCMRPLENIQQNVTRLTGNRNIVVPYPQCCITDKSSHVKCPNCGVRFCSMSCYEKAAEEYHPQICLNTFERSGNHPLEQLEETWKQMHYPPETCTISLLVRILAFINNAVNKDEIMTTISSFTHNVVNAQDQIAHKMLGETFCSQLEVLYRMLLQAVKPEPSVEQWLTPNGFRSLFALVGSNAQGIGTSPLAEWVNRVEQLELSDIEKQELDEFIDHLYDDIDKVSGQFLNSEGSGLYVTQSMANHSCAPNAQPTFPHSDYTVVLVAIKDITPGEEITISYLDPCVLQRSKHSRNKILSENYLFVCSCEKCESQSADPDETSDDSECEEEEEMTHCA